LVAAVARFFAAHVFMWCFNLLSYILQFIME
jgi:hypothetical protein